MCIICYLIEYHNYDPSKKEWKSLFGGMGWESDLAGKGTISGPGYLATSSIGNEKEVGLALFEGSWLFCSFSLRGPL